MDVAGYRAVVTHSPGNKKVQEAHHLPVLGKGTFVTGASIGGQHMQLAAKSDGKMRDFKIQ